MSTQVNKEAVQRVHEHIFGQTFSPRTDKYWEFPSPKASTQKSLFPPPEFHNLQGHSFTVHLDKLQQRTGLEFEQDQANRILIRLRHLDCSSGLLPGDIAVSLNGVECKDQSVFYLNKKIGAEGPDSLTLVVVPSPDSTEWSFRLVGTDNATSLQTLLPSAYSTPNGDVYKNEAAKNEDLQNPVLGSLCTRHFVTKTGVFSGLGRHICEIYLSVLENTYLHTDVLLNNGDTVFVSHRDGYTSGSIVESLPDDVFRVRLFPSKQMLDVSVDDIHKANSVEKQGVEDLMLLPQLNEPCLVYNLHSRFLASKPYTYAGDFALLAFNPMRQLDIYNDVVKQLFVGCQHRLDMPPHIYSVAQTALARLTAEVSSRRRRRRRRGSGPQQVGTASSRHYNQSECAPEASTTSATSAPLPVPPPTQAVCLLGRSGAGKSTNTEHLIEYLFARGSDITTSKVRAMMCLLDGFTCSRTLINSNASRCLRLFTIEFSAKEGEVGGADSLQLTASRLLVDLLMLDKFRVTRRPQGEPTLNIFYYFLAGLEDKYRHEYMLEDLSSPNLFMTPLQRPEDQALAKTRWEAVHEAARALGASFEEAFMEGVCRLLAAIYHLGCAGATPPSCSSQPGTPSHADGSQQRPRRRCFINLSAAERAARLLGCASVAALTADVFGCNGDADCGASGDSTRAPSSCSGVVSRSPSRHADVESEETTSESREPPSNLDLLGNFVANLFAIATNALRDLINISLYPSSESAVGSITTSRTSETGLAFDTRRSPELNSSLRPAARLLIIDPPGLQTPEAGGRLSGGSFEDLLYNYVNECLLQFYRDCQRSADNSGNIDGTEFEFVHFLDEYPSDQSLSSMQSPVLPEGPRETTLEEEVDEQEEDLKTTSTTWNCASSTLASPPASKMGLLWLVDYACSTGDMQTFLRLLAHKYMEHKAVFETRDSRVMRRLHRSGAFSLNHWNCTTIVQYHPATWLTSCHFTKGPRDVIGLLQRSSLSALRRIGDSVDEGASASALSVSSCSRLVESFILDTKYVVDLLRSCCLTACGHGGDGGVAEVTQSFSNIAWVHCILPVASAGLWQVAVAAAPASTSSAASAEGSSSPTALPRWMNNPTARFCVPLVRAQLHGLFLSTDLGYLRPAFMEGLRNDCNPSNRDQVPESPAPESVSDDAITMTNSNDCLAAIPPTTFVEVDNDEDGDVTTSTNPPSCSGASVRQPAFASSASDASAFEAVAQSATARTSETFNFVFNSNNASFPWEELIALAPVDRGLIKQLRHQLEELEETRDSLMRKQRTLQVDLDEVQQQLRDEQREKRAVELRHQTVNRQNVELQSRIEELEENLEEANIKNQRSALNLSTQSITSPGFSSYADELTQLINERNLMRDEISDLQARIATAASEKSGVADMEVVYLKAKVQELDGRLELETSTKLRLQSNVDRLKLQLQQVIAERDRLLTTVQNERQNIRRLSRILREAQEDKERIERRLVDEEQRRNETKSEVSTCVQEQFRLQQELSQILLKCKEEELYALGLRRKSSNFASALEEEVDDVDSEASSAIVEANKGNAVGSTQESVNRLSSPDAARKNGSHREVIKRNGSNGK